MGTNSAALAQLELEVEGLGAQVAAFGFSDAFEEEAFEVVAVDDDEGLAVVAFLVAGFEAPEFDPKLSP